MTLRVVLTLGCLAACHGAVTSCADAGSSVAGGGAPSDCAPSSCAAANVPAQRFDEARGCIAAPASVDGLCVGTVTGLRCGSASIHLGCAVAPDGGIYLGAMRGDEYFWGSGWRTDYYPVYGTPPPDGPRLSTDDLARCAAAQCAPPCPGASAPLLAGAGCRADGGVTDARGD